VNRWWKWAGIAAAVLAALAGAAVLVIYVVSETQITRQYPLVASGLHAAKGPAAIARGKHFAGAYGCADCHGRNLQGVYIPDFGTSSRNLTRLAASFTDADFDRAVRKGLRPDGTSVAEYMPSDAFQFIPDADMADIVAYIRSLKPAGKDVPIPAYDLKTRLGFLIGLAHMDRYWFARQKPALDLGPRYARGRILAMAACGECHMTALTGGPPELPGRRPPDLSLVASYDRADFLKFMRTGKAAGNRELPMMSSTARARFSHFSDDELNAIYDYLAARGRKLAGGGG
jgi:cytochrome c553